MGDLAEGVGRAGLEPVGADEAVGAGDADGVEDLEVGLEALGEEGGPDFDIVMGEYDDVALGAVEAAVVAFAEGFGVVDADDFVGFGAHEVAVMREMAVKLTGLMLQMTMEIMGDPEKGGGG